MANINIHDLINHGEMAYDKLFTEGKFEWFKSDKDMFVYTRNTDTGYNVRFNTEGYNGKRISDKEYFEKRAEMVARVEAASYHTEEDELTEEQEAAVEATEESETTQEAEEIAKAMADLPEGFRIEAARDADGEPSFYRLYKNGEQIDSCFHLDELVERARKEAEPKKERKPRAKKVKVGGMEFTCCDVKVVLTPKQVDFIKHLPDTCFWEDGLDSCIWVDCLCDEIGGQFENKPMTVGAMISTICEKGLGVRGNDRRNGRKVTSFALTEVGKQIAAQLGVH